MEEEEELLVTHDLVLPLLAVDLLEGVEGGAGEIEAIPVDVFEVGCPADGRFLSTDAAAHTVDDPFRTRMFSL